MSEEEKKAIEKLKSIVKVHNDFMKDIKREFISSEEIKALEIALNLIENQQKELNNLKEIEKSHKEENGKLRIELEQYKLLEANIDKANRIIAENKFDEGLYGLLMQEKEKSKELNEALERSSGRATELTVENSKLKYQLYHKQQMIDELTQNEEQLKIELGKEKENLKIAVAMLTKGTYPEENEGDNDFDKYFISKDKVKDMMKYREFELQQEYKEFEEDVEWRTYKKILEV